MPATPSPVRLLNNSDIPAAMRLKEAAGWNQTGEDWRRLVTLAPDACFGIDCDGVLAATMTAICYEEELAWIGMVLTAPEFRKRGFARTLMGHTLDHLRRRGVSWAKLDATAMGAGIYSDFDFRLECPVERWQRSADALPVFEADCSDQVPELAAIVSRDAFEVSRAPLLGALLRSGGASLAGSGFALWRPGSSAQHFGPCVAADMDSAERLLRRGLHANSGLPLIWDLAPQNAAAPRLAQKYGFKRIRSLSRMACALRPGAQPLQAGVDSIFALAGCEYG
jgi:GNAT superfamily N-acetyltransferase